MIYMYMPILIVCGLTILGSGSSAIFIGVVLIAVLFIGGMPWKEIMYAILAGVVGLGLLMGIHVASDGKFIGRLGTVISRLNTSYDPNTLEEMDPNSIAYDKAVDNMRQPYGARIAVHEGRLIGKGSGNSTQKYTVTNMYGDYMYSFLLEEYGLAGGIIILLLYVSLLARGSMIARLCTNEFAQIAVGGLTVLITGQAFMHMFVSVGIGPMTGQTLPLVSHGASAFLCFCIAFGVILSISRMARKKIQEEEEAAAPLYESDRDDIQVTLDVLEQLDSIE
jgi:cell division protein FtsW